MLTLTLFNISVQTVVLTLPVGPARVVFILGRKWWNLLDNRNTFSRDIDLHPARYKCFVFGTKLKKTG